ncbi:hypothetical protein KUCAC02_014629 [Chaenocephalus aceratus]|uniref:Uncharacterized protein n=1 Tax=Chaenocephalus aceratus TaxID=36190 RepID=A0ACB9WFY7_CHAAC|nr:hypothetical protein KUCAC02_014629 [Chaenocephalus aceratus]
MSKGKQGQFKVSAYVPLLCAWSQALAHYKGTKHAKKLKALDSSKSKLKGSVVTKETTNQEIAKGINTSQVPIGTDRKGFGTKLALMKSTVQGRVMAILRTTGRENITFSDSAFNGCCSWSNAPAAFSGAPIGATLGILDDSHNANTGPRGLTHRPEHYGSHSPETTSAAGGDSTLNSPSEPDLEPETEPEVETDAETEEEKARRLLYCSLCKVAVNSASQLDAHNSGTKHKTMLEARTGVGSIKSFPRPGVKSKLAPVVKSLTGLQNKTFHSHQQAGVIKTEQQVNQPNRNYSPYSKPQGQTNQPVKLSLGKERLCPLNTQIIPAHLAAVAAAISNSFTHRTNHITNHASTPNLFQTQTIPAALLRPAPGPVRTSHPQLLFAPY